MYMKSHKLVYGSSLFSVFKFLIVLYLYKIHWDDIHLKLLSISLDSHIFPVISPLPHVLYPPFLSYKICAGSHSSYAFMIKMVVTLRQESFTIFPISFSFYILPIPYLQCFLDLREVTSHSRTIQKHLFSVSWPVLSPNFGHHSLLKKLSLMKVSFLCRCTG